MPTWSGFGTLSRSMTPSNTLGIGAAGAAANRNRSFLAATGLAAANTRFKQRPATLVLLLLTLGLSSCATFSSDPRVRTPGAMFDDEVLEKLVEQEIRRSDAEFDSAHLVIVSYDGIVLLLGQVSTEALKTKAGTVTQGIAKVRGVHNELGVGGPLSYLARSNDGWLTGKVKSKLIAAKTAPGRKVKVQTENGVVYLMGLLTRAEADAAVEVAKSVYGVQEIVRVFEYID